MLGGNPSLEGNEGAHFPQCVVDYLGSFFKQYDEEVDLHKRAIRPTDRDFSLAVISEVWRPTTGSLELLGRKNTEHTLNRYDIKVQCLTRDLDEERGIVRHSAFSDSVRTLLYRSSALQIGFNLLSVDILGRTETAKKLGITQQQFLNQMISNQFLFLSTLDVWIETETL